MRKAWRGRLLLQGLSYQALGALFGRTFERRKIARALDDAHDLRPVTRQTIKRQPTLNHQSTRLRLNLGAGSPKLRMLGKERAPFFDAVIKSVSKRLGISGSDVKPNIQQVFARGA